MRTKMWLLAALVAVSVIGAGYEVVFHLHHADPRPGALYLWDFIFGILLALWIDADSKEHSEIYRPYEFGYLLLFLWLPYLPYYLWRTRRARGLLLLGGFLALFFLGFLVRLAIDAMR
jgi:peptidoglycan/LPS O-acetylase OafA/YrhL